MGCIFQLNTQRNKNYFYFAQCVIFPQKRKTQITMNTFQGLCHYTKLSKLLLLITIKHFLIPSALENPLELVIIDTNMGLKSCFGSVTT